jgi:hypothetical protein
MVWIGNCGKFLYKTKCEQENQVEKLCKFTERGEDAPYKEIAYCIE